MFKRCEWCDFFTWINDLHFLILQETKRVDETHQTGNPDLKFHLDVQKALLISIPLEEENSSMETSSRPMSFSAKSSVVASQILALLL